MNRPRDRLSTKGLLPRMHARPRKDGLTTYRYTTIAGKHINLGTDRMAACQRVLDTLKIGEDMGTVRRLWEQYQQTPGWRDLAPRSQADYKAQSVPLLGVFGTMQAKAITAPMVAQYLRVERGNAPVRANREVSLLGNLIALAIERGEAEHNPCKGGQVKRNKERPRTTLPALGGIAALVELANAKGGQWKVIVMAAQFAALTGSRQCELLTLHWPQFSADVVRLRRAKQRGGAEKIEQITVSPALLDLRTRLQDVAHNRAMGVVFPNRHGNAYTVNGFATMWCRLRDEALAKGVILESHTFHDLRAHYATQYKISTGQLPDMHANVVTTAKVYERSRVSKRDSL